MGNEVISSDMSLRERSRRTRKRRRKLRIRRTIFAICCLIVLSAAAGGVYGIVKLSGYIFKNDAETVKAQSIIEEASVNEINNGRNSINLVETKKNSVIEKYTEKTLADEADTIKDDKDIVNEKNWLELEDKYGEIEPGSNGLIIVDAGHGGTDGGTGSDITEKEVNLNIAYWLKEELELRGYSVYMTRTDDSFVGLNERVRLANAQSGAKALVSIHQNSIEGHPEIFGVESWTYNRTKCTELAECLADSVAASVEGKNRGVYYRTNLVVTSKASMPSAIIECGYMSNNDEYNKLITEDYQIKISQGIADGIDSFLGIKRE